MYFVQQYVATTGVIGGGPGGSNLNSGSNLNNNQKTSEHYSLHHVSGYVPPIFFQILHDYDVRTSVLAAQLRLC